MTLVSATLRDWMIGNAPTDLVAPLADACASTGRRKGRVLSSVPSKKGPKAVGAWRALMFELAPSRAGIFGLVLAEEAERETFDRVNDWLDTPYTIGDKTLRAKYIVRFAGGAPLEFHTDHMRVNHDALRLLGDAADIDADALGVEEN